MHSFHYRDGQLHCEDVALQPLAEQHGSPLYVYSAATIRDHFTRLDASLNGLDHLICYATKANSNLAILNLLAKLGSGFDIVSGGELERVRRVGVPSNRVIFAGVGKTETEMRAALKAGVLEFNLESEAEAERLNAVAASMKKIAPIWTVSQAARINPARINPTATSRWLRLTAALGFATAISHSFRGAAASERPEPPRERPQGQARRAGQRRR